jgi:phosphohistidine phosphatase
MIVPGDANCSSVGGRDMELFLMQHGVAEPEDVDPRRPLTAIGAAEVVAVAKFARACGVTVDEVWHSGKLRAAQTATLLAGALAGPAGPPPVTARGGLDPDSPPAPIAGWVRGIAPPRRVAIVGHLPFLARFTAVLTGGDPERGPVGFQNAGLVKLVRGDAGRFQIAWVLTADLVAAIRAGNAAQS